MQQPLRNKTLIILSGKNIRLENRYNLTPDVDILSKIVCEQ